MNNSIFTTELTWQSIADLLAPYRQILFIGISLDLVSSLVVLVVPWLAGRFTDNALVAASRDVQGPTLLLLLLASFLVQAALSYFVNVRLSDVCERLAVSVKEQVYDHLQRLPLLTISRYSRGHLLNLFEQDANAVASFFVGTLSTLPRLLVTFCGAAALTFFLSPAVAVMAVILLPLFFVLVRLLGREIRPIVEETYVETARAVSLLEENLSQLKLIKSTGSEDAELSRFGVLNQRILKLNRRRLWVGTLLAPVVRFAGASGIVLLLWASVVFAGSNLSIGEMVSLLLYGMLMINPVSSLAGTYGSYQSTSASVARIAEIMGSPPEDYDSDSFDPIGRSPEIEFRDVWFAYDSQEPVVKGLNLIVRPGETVLITGNNGVGKSTLMDLLCRFIEPDRGRILIDGIDIRTMKLPTLRRCIGFIHQDSKLLNRSIRENINFGRFEEQEFEEQEFKEHEFKEQEKQNNDVPALMEFVENLKCGYETQIVQSGSNLSGGQGQRVMLARILRNRQPIVILDEAMSMQDPNAEARFMAQAKAQLSAQTVLIVSHNERLINYADRLVRMESGVINE